MTLKIITTLFCLQLFGLHPSFSQPFHLKAIHEKFYDVEKKTNTPGSNFHTSVKPFYEDQASHVFTPDSIMPENNLFIKKLMHDNFFHAEKSDFFITADPLFAIVPSINADNQDLSVESSWGVSLKCKFNNLLTFSGDFSYNHSSFNKYLKNKTDSIHAVPGMGFAHRYGGNYEYNTNTFYVAYKPVKYFIFEAGMGKHFIGDGYRSMLLSYNAYNYPYFKIETNIWKLKYMNLWTNFKDIRNTNSSVWEAFYNKYGTIHYLSWNATRRLNIGLYEAIIWKHGEGAQTRGFDLQYANPVIFFRPVEFSLGSPDNALMGINLKVAVCSNILLYSQIVIDDMIAAEMKNDMKHLFYPADTGFNYGSWMNKQAIQAGVKFFDLFKIKNLYFQTEWNAARPYTYSHVWSKQNYGHYNQPLAHPLGANFFESISRLKYQIKKWSFEAKFMYAITGLDSTNSHFGADIYKSTFNGFQPLENNVPVKDYGNHIGQGITTNIYFGEFKISYLINRKNNLRAEAGYINRTQQSAIKSSTDNFFYLGIRTTIPERYYDF